MTEPKLATGARQVHWRKQYAARYRAHLAEFGIVTAKGSNRVATLTDKLDVLPEAARLPLQALFDQLHRNAGAN